MDKEIKGATKTYTVVIRDEDNNVIDPINEVDQIDIYVTNFKTGTVIEQFTTEAGPPTGFSEITTTTVDASFTISDTSTLAAESGDNKVRIVITTGTDIQEVFGLLNEFI